MTGSKRLIRCFFAISLILSAVGGSIIIHPELRPAQATGSMEGTIDGPGIAYCQTVEPETVEQGEVVSVWHEYHEHRIIHRVTDTRSGEHGTELKTQGDAVDRSDGWTHTQAPVYRCIYWIDNPF